jgi:myosin heavy subunit
MNSNYCFINDPETVYKLVKIISRNVVDKTLTVADYDNPSKQVKVKEDTTIPVGSIEELENPPADLIKLQYVNRPGILHTLRSRFMHDLIYTSIGQILVALNPFKWIKGIYDTDVKEKYKTRVYNLSDNPHIFAIAHDAYTDLNLGQNQSMIISGESGAGKTEATKQCLNYLAFIAGSSGGIQEKILKASPILEAWGNAKTLRNNNSSRFGKYIEIWFDNSQTIVGSSNTTYILEKSRVVRQEENERNYHVFYQLLQGGSHEFLTSLKLIAPGQTKPKLDSYNFINQSGCITIDDVDDAQEFQDANQAFAEIGFSTKEQNSLYQTIAGILHLGNLEFVGNPDDAMIANTTEEALRNASEMFCVTVEEFRQALLYRKITSGSKRKSVVLAPYNPVSALDSRDALAKEIYRRCFDWIVYKINQLMYTPSVSASLMIGVLDIFGFEIFKKVSGTVFFLLFVKLSLSFLV